MSKGRAAIPAPAQARTSMGLTAPLVQQARGNAAAASSLARKTGGRANDGARGGYAAGREQHDKRGADTPSGVPESTFAQFQDATDKPPEFHHDHGFLDDGSGNLDESKREEPGLADYLSLAKWIAKLEAAEALRPDLVDGTSAYRHFLTGGGARREVDYQRFIDTDSSGAKVLSSAMEDGKKAAIEKHDSMIGSSQPQPGKTSFNLQTGIIPVGRDGRYPYPATENWQKALGAHQIWLELAVTVDVAEVEQHDPVGVPAGSSPMCTPEGDTTFSYIRNFDVEMTIHMEDRYNFNPGMADIATGTPDADNGRFEITGLGHEYTNFSTLQRDFAFEAGHVGAPVASDTSSPVDAGRAPRTDRAADARPYPTSR